MGVKGMRWLSKKYSRHYFRKSKLAQKLQLFEDKTKLLIAFIKHKSKFQKNLTLLSCCMTVTFELPWEQRNKVENEDPSARGKKSCGERSQAKKLLQAQFYKLG